MLALWLVAMVVAAPRQARLGWICLTLDFVEVGS
jgi:hypothetical protein